MNKNFLILFALILPGIFCAGQAQNSVEPIRFQIKNAGITVDGVMTNWEYDISFDPKRPDQAHIKGFANPATINTGIKLRDRHLQGRQYFKTDEFPQISLISKKVNKTGRNSYSGLFEVKIKDIVKEVEIPFTVQIKGKQQIFNGEFIINRLDFGVGEKSLILGDEVRILLSLTK